MSHDYISSKGGFEMTRLINVLLFSALFFVMAFVPFSHSYADSTAPSQDESLPAKNWDDWPCKNLKTDWNYLFHPDLINQYIPPANSIDQNEGQDHG
jgi:hypothetical protein